MFIRLLENNISVRNKNYDSISVLKNTVFPCLHFNLNDNNLIFEEKTYQCAKISKRDYPVLQSINMLVLKFKSNETLLLQSFNTKILVHDEEEEIIPKKIEDLLPGDSVLRFNNDIDYEFDNLVSITSMPITSDEELEEQDVSFKRSYHKYIIGSNNTSWGMIVNDLFLI